ncbi:MAG TPA: glycoside hydrolase family 3 N-terminal domain-containing protein [Candidatus Polarisedimenticolia bacterium]|jgi:beta-N-acetylhexosaminidase
MTSRIGELLFVGFDGTEMSVELRAFLGRIRPGGFILFKRNIVDPVQTLRLIADLRAMFDPPPIIAVDEEGGQVSRMRPMAPTLPSSARLAASGDAQAVRAMAASMGRVLASAGFDLDFAPVVDLCRPDSPNGIGDRSFGADTEVTCVMAAAYLDGLADASMNGCLKHFPGLGPTLFDSHHHLPTVQKEEAPFRREDLHPYRRLHERVPVVMVGHGHYPFLSGADPIAATLSAPVVTGLLRGEIGFTGVALADDLEMKAVSARVPFRELAPRVVSSGCDMALVCRRREAIEDSLDGLRDWVESGRLDGARVAEALARVEELRARVARTRAGTTPSIGSFRAACADLSSRLEAFA